MTVHDPVPVGVAALVGPETVAVKTIVEAMEAVEELGVTATVGVCFCNSRTYIC